MNDIAIKIENLKKEYKLGAIGGSTLRAELESWWARKTGKEDPNTKIGEDTKSFGEKFLALDGINLTIKKGEAVGIIGGNGAGKSTLLKILSRITAPTEGDVWINGRIASMLEVGTGFHGELTGRENIYMNGAILGMTKKEVDEKIESIIDFSECRQFIDTPVKRYSSGMYVKLAFAVASHLDAEIMIMDEVLAVGDMAFQKKCLGKMGDEAKGGKTVLYVSHNMATIRNLCTRVIVLNKGKIIFDGDVEKGIDVYMDCSEDVLGTYYNLRSIKRANERLGIKFFINSVEFLNSTTAIFKNTDKIELKIDWISYEDLDLRFGVFVRYIDGTPVGLSESKDIIKIKKNEKNTTIIYMDISNLVVGRYYISIQPYYLTLTKNSYTVDESIYMPIEIIEGNENDYRVWMRQYWGNVRLSDIVLDKNNDK